MKKFQIIYYNSLGDLIAIQLKAKTEKQAYNKFRRDYGYYTIKSITEVE